MDRYSIAWSNTMKQDDDGQYALYSDAQDAIDTARAEALKEAFEAGYTQGHNDTVENCVRDYREAALEYILADKQEGGNA